MCVCELKNWSDESDESDDDEAKRKCSQDEVTCQKNGGGLNSFFFELNFSGCFFQGLGLLESRASHTALGEGGGD